MKVPTALPQILVLTIIMQLSSASILGTMRTLGSVAASAVMNTTTTVVDAGSTTVHVGSGVVMTTVSSQCKALQAASKLVQNVVKPDYEKLTVIAMSPEANTTYKLSSLSTELPASGFLDDCSRVVMFHHGYTDSPSGSACQLIYEAFESLGDKTCFLAVDASDLIGGIDGIFYPASTESAPTIAKKLAESIAPMITDGYMSSDKIHLIGHSLGAQIMGITGTTLSTMTGQKVSRATALDAAGPCFANIETLKFNQTAAVFTDCIHSNAGVFGTEEVTCHADFYPNGGSKQPGCSLVLVDTCSHSRVYELFAASIENNYSFPAFQCNDYDEFKAGNCTTSTSYMGIAANTSCTGKFYMDTGSGEPWMMA